MRPIVLLLALAALGRAQESRLGAEFRRESDQVKEACSSFSFKSIASCGYTLFTDHPLHIAAGSLAPQNGFGLGGAFVYHWTPNNSWRLSWDIDAVGSTNGSWRAGGYLTAIWTRHRHITITTGGTGTSPSNLGVTEYPVFHVVAQNISLNTITYFGIGPNTSDTARSYYGMRETVVGANVVWPLVRGLNLSAFGEMNGRFVDLRAALGRSSPSIEQLYSPATAPGLTTQPGFAQFGEGLRIRPALAGGYLRLNYSANFQQFVAGDSVYSFQRLTTDFQHQIPIYKRTRALSPPDHNGPDECALAPGGEACPAAVSRNLEGSIQFRVLLTQSFVPSGHVVPFYFQPTLGGSDINGAGVLGSYQDYRFRAPNNILIRAGIEHSIWGPLGTTAFVDQGKVAVQRGDLDFTHLRHSYTVGLTLRAGGFPMVLLLYSWGGKEGTHMSGVMNNSLLGGGARPSLY
jgi:hypothetical protein